VGLTVVAAVTSIPEMFFAINSTIRGETALSINTVVGSNIANIGLVLGIAFLLMRVRTPSEHLFKSALLLVALTCVALGLFLDDYISRIDGMVLATGYFIAIIWALRLERPGGPIYSAYDASFGVNISIKACASNAIAGSSLVAIALVFLYSGAEQYGDLADGKFGILVVAVLTSLPELYVCVVSAARRESEFAIGVVIGSNLINLCLTLGITATIQPSKPPTAFFSYYSFVMVAFSMVLVAMMLELNPDKKKDQKLEGLALLGAYLAFLAYTLTMDS
jgi:cation:H+ antiporter